MLPHPGQVGEPQIDHLDLLVLDRLHEVFGCRAFWKHGFTPVVEKSTLRSACRSAAAERREISVHIPRCTPPCRTSLDPTWRRSHSVNPVTCEPADQLWCGPRMIFMASSICRQVLA